MLTRSTRPSTSWPLSWFTTSSASFTDAMVTKPNPRLRPVSRSVIRRESSTAPISEHRSWRSRWSMPQDRFPKYTLRASNSKFLSLPAKPPSRGARGSRGVMGPRSVRAADTFTFRERPSTSTPSRLWMTASAWDSSLTCTKPKPRERPVTESNTTVTSPTLKSLKTSRRESSFIPQLRFPTYSLTPSPPPPPPTLSSAIAETLNAARCCTAAREDTMMGAAEMPKMPRVAAARAPKAGTVANDAETATAAEGRTVATDTAEREVAEDTVAVGLARARPAVDRAKATILLM
mmetsp:Transcript_37402/g.92514  ORF Transcript_37402/g.92514 Transcript_37402/m.92514 type:complete len:291 (+) Transcript_37402:326-1198(+)